MAILSTIKKGYLLIKTATGYVKLLPRTLATLVSMADGSTVESQITALKGSVSELNSKSTIGLESMTEVYAAVANSTAKVITVCKVGNIVDINVSVKLTSAVSAYQILFTLPAEYRPSEKIQIAAAGTSAKPYLIIMTNGKVQVQGAYAANEFVVFGRTYIL